ncbi:MAG: hypothetical protein ACOC5K_01240 [Chloroflexota bacterium]
MTSSRAPLCPYCEHPMFRGAAPTSRVEEAVWTFEDSVVTGVVIWCGNCNKLLSILPPDARGARQGRGRDYQRGDFQTAAEDRPRTQHSDYRSAN